MSGLRSSTGSPSIVHFLAAFQKCPLLCTVAHYFSGGIVLTGTRQSVECQRASWKTTHQYTCVYVAPLPSLGDGDFDKRFNKIVDRWVHEWREILDNHSMTALDLVNYPDRQATHA